MKTRNPWVLGLQWGAWAWLGYIALEMCLYFAQSYSLAWRREFLPIWMNDWIAYDHGQVLAATWMVAFALVTSGSRWARAAVAIAIVGQAAQRCGLRSWLPMCAPLLPLAVLRAEEPRVVLALLALGRRRE